MLLRYWARIGWRISLFIGRDTASGKNFYRATRVKTFDLRTDMKGPMTTAASVLALLALLGTAGCSRSHRAAAGSGSKGKITGSPSDPPVTFQALWNPSNRYIFRSEITTSAEMPRQGSAKLTPQQSTLGLDYVITVSNVRSNGSRSLELEITSVQFDCTSGDTVLISYDSLNKVVGTDGNPMAERLEKIIGNKITFQLSASNRVSNVRGINEITDTLFTGGTTRAQTMVRRLFNPQYLRHLVDLIALPVDPVRVQDTWPGQLSISSGPLTGGLNADVTYTFRGWQKRDQRNCALVEFTGALKPRAANPSSKAISGTVENGTVNGQSWFDPELGMVVESASDQTATTKGSIRWRRAATNSIPQTYTSNVRQRTSMKLVDVEATKPAGT